MSISRFSRFFICSLASTVDYDMQRWNWFPVFPPESQKRSFFGYISAQSCFPHTKKNPGQKTCTGRLITNLRLSSFSSPFRCFFSGRDTRISTFLCLFFRGLSQFIEETFFLERGSIRNLIFSTSFSTFFNTRSELSWNSKNIKSFFLLLSLSPSRYCCFSCTIQSLMCGA